MSLKYLLIENKVNELNNQRRKIDDIDSQIIELLVQRTQAVLEIAKLKQLVNAKTVQKGRWKQVLNKISSEAKSNDLDPESIKEIWNTIHKQSIKVQEEYRSNES